MKTSNELKELRASKITEQENLMTLAKTTEKREFTTEEGTKFDGLQSEIEGFDAQILRAVNVESAEARAAATSGVVIGESEKSEQKSMLRSYSLHKAIRSQLPNNSLDGVEGEYHAEMQKEARAAGVSLQGIAIPTGKAEKRDANQTVSQDSGAYGANLVSDGFGGVIDALRANPIIERLGAKYLRGLSGDLKFATNGGGIAATWETEIATTSATKNAYGVKTMSPNRLSSTVGISLQNILQSTPDLELLTASEIRMSKELAIDIAAINGTGSGQPEGILNNSDVNVLTGATNGIAPTWAQLVAMETAVAGANALDAQANYLITPGLKGLLKTTAHAANTGGYLMQSDNSINGYSAGVSTMVPSNITKGSGTDLHAAIFGVFSNILIGEWGFSDMVVDNITQKKSGIIEITMNQFLDILIRQGAAFSVSKDFIV